MKPNPEQKQKNRFQAANKYSNSILTGIWIPYKRSLFRREQQQYVKVILKIILYYYL